MVFTEQSAPSSFTRSTLRRGSEGPEVADLQRKLQIHADSVFGETTQAAVMKFHLAHGLKADGIVSEKTHLALFGSGDRQTWTEIQGERINHV